MIVPLLLFIIAILLIAIYWELCKINGHLKKALFLVHQERQSGAADAGD